MILKTEDLKTAYLKSDDSKFACVCWEPQNCRYTHIHQNVCAVIKIHIADLMLNHKDFFSTGRKEESSFRESGQSKMM